MGPHQTKKLLHSKNKRTTNGRIYLQIVYLIMVNMVNIQYTQRTSTSQNNQSGWKMGTESKWTFCQRRHTDEKNVPLGTWKNAECY